MKRVQMYIEPELDQMLAAEASRRKVSKASLLRAAAREKYLPPTHEPDALDALVGAWPEGEPLKPGDIDRIVYKTDRDSGGNLLPPDER